MPDEILLYREGRFVGVQVKPGGPSLWPGEPIEGGQGSSLVWSPEMDIQGRPSKKSSDRREPGERRQGSRAGR